MKILIVADHESRKIWDYFEPGMLNKYDLILSAGDLHPHYMSFLATMGHTEVLYVHGNHDDCYETTPPDGCICIDGHVVNYRGLRIFGLGGSMRYKDGVNMYTEKEMKRRVAKARLELLRNGGFDILLAHAPAAGINDADDLPHRGFQEFVHLMDQYHPHYFIHGHNHKNYSSGYKREDNYNGTIVINAWETYELDYPDEWLGKPSRLDDLSFKALQRRQLKDHSEI
ncbi:MAG: metallophosphoesterase family protein [Lachnospiraceae bacterium]|nr:metallophosphoesterase family protein [Lachnospiraceae bacterium]